jgi:hypothetical protein
LTGSVAEPALGIVGFVTLRKGVARAAARVEPGIRLKMAATALDQQVVALVHGPKLDVLVPCRGYNLPGRARIVTLRAVVRAPLGMPGLVAVDTGIGQAPKVWIGVAHKAVHITVGAGQFHRVARSIDLGPGYQGRVAARTGHAV